MTARVFEGRGKGLQEKVGGLKENRIAELGKTSVHHFFRGALSAFSESLRRTESTHYQGPRKFLLFIEREDLWSKEVGRF
jgi:hypothetical protein